MDPQQAWDWSSLNSGQPAAAQERSMPDVPLEDGPTTSEARSSDAHQPQPKPQRRRYYGPRTCRICLDTEEPKFPEEVSSTFGIATQSSEPIYASDDPDLGRLLCPCKCKGSQKYVHEGCLNAWRYADPHGTRNYWQCPTCKFTYQMRRLRWAGILSSRITQGFLTIIISLFAILCLGWIADPILDLWLDPFGTISDTVVSVVRDVEARDPIYDVPPSTWHEQFLKGFMSLGIIGFLKTVVFLTPWDWLNLRGTGLMRRGGRGGRGRMDNVNSAMVIVGAVTFVMAMWRVVRAMTARVLKKMSDRVLDVGGDDYDESDEPSETRKDQ
ncbi:RING-variant domain-containing protein [Sarocladium implicatum]|nr:RING-variant domain-containing protein [Sarocladium implicatum]